MSRLELLRQMPCAIGAFYRAAIFKTPHAPLSGTPEDVAYRCIGTIEAHHHTGHRGIGQKSDDEKTFPLCHKHHMNFHDAKGLFKAWTKEQRREWQDRLVEKYDQILCDPEAF